MDYKEKYDEAIKRARKELQACGSSDCDAARQIFRFFPELAENKDKMIREWLIDTIKSVPNDSIEWDVINKSDVLDWLEKQGENSVCKVKIGETYKCIASPRYTCFRSGDIYHVKDNFVAELISTCSDCFVLLEKKAEQKPADKVEPKFKIGQTVVYKGSENIAPTKITISDIVKGQYWDDNCCIVPISDQDNWELVEQKPIDKVEPKFNVGDTIAEKNNSDIHDFGSFTITDITGGKYWYNDRIICDILEQDEWEIYEPVRQKPAEWSKEDGNLLKLSLENLTELKDRFGEGYGKVGDCITWLKSLKERYTWKPSNEQMKALCKFIDT